MNYRQTRTVVLFAVLLAAAATPFLPPTHFPPPGGSQGYDLGTGGRAFTLERSFVTAAQIGMYLSFRTSR